MLICFAPLPKHTEDKNYIYQVDILPQTIDVERNV